MKKEKKFDPSLIKAIIFDLDDTLFAERDFLLSGFNAVAAEIAKKSKVEKNIVLTVLLYELEKNGRGKIFNTTLRYFSLSDNPEEVAYLVHLYRNHKANISFYTGVRSLLERLKTQFHLAVVTDGATEIQKNKIQALGVEKFVDKIVYCWQINAPKPDPKGYASILEYFELPAENIMIIGDHPLNDISAGKKLGTWTARVRTGRFIDFPHIDGVPPDFDINIITEIENILMP